MEHSNNSDWEQSRLEEELLEQQLCRREFAEEAPAGAEPSSSDPRPGTKPGHSWQATKESWYDKLNVSVRQLDIIIGVAAAALLVVVILIALEALHLR